MLTISIPRPILEGIFNECDRFAADETGGRLLGYYTWQGIDLHIDVRAVIGAGPNARRSRTSLFQDGEYQERIFRAVERKHPEIEHLGNWHTHHVNGLRTLSSGDVETYQKIVRSSNHNTNFFYSLLVTQPTPGGESRFAVKHYIFYRSRAAFTEVPASNVDTNGKEVLSL